MTTVTTIVAIYVLIWWLTFFAVLPFGVRSQQESGDFVGGTDPGAPAVHRVWIKVLYTSVISAAIFAVLYLVYTNDLLPLEFLKRISQPPES
jgi:predicted secreted protein